MLAVDQLPRLRRTCGFDTRGWRIPNRLKPPLLPERCLVSVLIRAPPADGGVVHTIPLTALQRHEVDSHPVKIAGDPDGPARRDGPQPPALSAQEHVVRRAVE